MRLVIVLFLFVLLPVVLTQSNCQQHNIWLMDVLNVLIPKIDENLNAACDVPSKKLILQYMINMLNVLSLRIKKPCVFTFQPLAFSSTCPALDFANIGFYDMLGRTNYVLDGFCAPGANCPVDQAAYNEVINQKTNLQNILASLNAG
ncbi:hypothetical protein L596_008922 [Steinernema carpocapsae]|uniref:Uncharacterized protein n=1 Tax=Steinernema carpocapsae TaxID=34508 RepID=A0A4U5PEP3_STECR|nr:hypothetical protein L596_008922 [Steinernema carpocapsae]